ncbi:GNAT family N-acetyltransferase [Sphingopyxis sp. PAMC25046]|uniref:GNAT family N-acetyltransferase n=1 Tax=Sphingopyxis sp. PAMC25046 TaxID=2565556 RepID=UPI00109DE9D2|nr:GNAT family N-acetyltransferase [Sphingopyxis sp. PAMC25046]QCB53936.1 GNAT family N-acetyltransferase [Sphingopyxis sp. PAMC25046]
MPHPFPVRAPFAIVPSMSMMQSATSFLASPRDCDLFPAAAGKADAFWPALAHLEASYPGFGAWYWSKVVPGLDNATRQILHVGDVENPAAIAIVKRDNIEAKICTLWVSETCRGKGVGGELMAEAIDWIGHAHPLFTVPAERYEEFRPLMARFRFEETMRIPSLYRSGVVEHVYNGQLLPTLVS